MNRRGKELIHDLLRLCPVLDAERAAQRFNVGQVFFWPARHELASQDISQVAWYVQMQLLVGFEQPHRRKLILTQFKQKGRTIIIEEHLMLAPESMTFPNSLNDPANLVGGR